MFKRRQKNISKVKVSNINLKLFDEENSLSEILHKLLVKVVENNFSIVFFHSSIIDRRENVLRQGEFD